MRKLQARINSLSSIGVARHTCSSHLVLFCYTWLLQHVGKAWGLHTLNLDPGSESAAALDAPTCRINAA
jgi:hypothetical protein